MPRSTPQNANQESSHKKHSRPGQQQSLKSRRFDPLAISLRKEFRGTTHSNLSPESVAPQDSSADLRSHERTEHPDLVLQSLPSTSRAVDQGIDAALQDAHHFSTGASGNTRSVTTDQQNVTSWGTGHIDPELHSDWSTPRAAIFEKAHNFSIENAPIMNIGHQLNINHQHGNSHGSYGLYSLKEFVSFNALHDSSAQDPERCCHSGTRRNVLDKMRTWMDDPNAPEHILWLHGPAGVGKSAIAQTISYSYGRDKIGASFSFFRSDPTRNDGNRLFPTLAWRLASSVPVVKDRIAFSLEEDPDIPRKAIEIQFDQLIAQPVLTVSGGESAAPTSMRVIIIDGLDECSDVKLQERILKIIGNAATNARFPLRFVISSRPEANIQDFFDQFQSPTLQIDLANVDDAFRDIETHLTSEFARIAVEQKLDPKTWPAQSVIYALVFKSSGQFVYASTVIKNVGDKYESAVAQLDVILGLKPSTGKSPFSELDALYTEILQRQPDQNFLKKFLPVLVARSMLSGVKDLHKDDAMLLGLEERQLHRKLRGMCSILKFEPFLDVHHKSFLDFLDDSSRSGEYHVSKHFANRRYMQRITDVLVKAASKVMEQADSHRSGHFQPRFATIIRESPLIGNELPLNDLEEILQPLLVIQEKLLQLPNMSLPWKPRACGECWTFYIIDYLLLHLACFRGTTQLQELKYVGIRPLIPIEQKQKIPQLDLDTCLSLLLAELRSVESQLSLSADTIGLVRALIRFNPTETAMKVLSMTDAQNLLELIFCLNKKECFKSWFGAAAHNATLLALAIYGRVPVLPRSLFLNNTEFDADNETYQGKAVTIWGPNTVWRDCFNAFMWSNLSHGSLVPCLGICFKEGIVIASALPEDEMLNNWRRGSNPSVSQIQQIIFEVAKAIQYVHSLGIRISYIFEKGDIYLDSDNHAKVQFPGFRPNDMCEEQFNYHDDDGNFTLEDNIRQLGLLFYEVLFNKKYSNAHKTRPSEPEIPDNVWQLIQRCCSWYSELPKIDQVVQEMKSWIALGQFTLAS
ncbi:hypothetical protein M378DRAFT_173426 [Amanita muscaria Koide BX008]|uniref:NACHT domain-containing protein n=1 Tax=Amanita muscaria (strain Koide BX008) TaxID=946122 RepID=A0A0C2SNW8_AMAMK|nr:hypothetical protein M378DRAFT_173426 [Amanita muscaria Koide BX008]